MFVRLDNGWWMYISVFYLVETFLFIETWCFLVQYKAKRGAIANSKICSIILGIVYTFFYKNNFRLDFQKILRTTLELSG